MPSRTGSTGLTDDLVVLFKGRIYPKNALEAAGNEIDAALKTIKVCKYCGGFERCQVNPRGWQVFYDEEGSQFYNYKHPCFRWRQCKYWRDEQQKEALKPRFQQRTFENFTVTDKNQHAFEVCKRYAGEFHRMTHKGLLLTGPPGTGKTHLAVSIHREVLAKGIASVFVNMPNLVNELLQSFKSSEESLTYIAALEKRLVVIDDLGAERLRDWVQEHVYRLVNERYEKMLPLVVTTNCNVEELEERLGGPAVDRLAEMCEIVTIEEKSWRRRK